VGKDGLRFLKVILEGAFLYRPARPLALAADHLRSAINLATANGLTPQAVGARTSLALVLLYLGETRQALEQTDVATTSARGTALGRVLNQRALLLQRLGRHSEAHECYRRALRIFRRHHQPIWEARVLLNRAVGHWRPRAALSPGELMVVYIALGISEVFAGHDMLQNMFGSIGFPYYHATPENHWAERFLGLVPTWLFVNDQTSLHAFYTGNANPYDWRLLAPWLPRLARWGAFVMALVVVMLGMNILLRG